MNDDKYFMKRAEELRNKIQDAKIDSNHLTFEQIDEITCLAMKEVARDQRYACVEAFMHGIKTEMYLYTDMGNPKSYHASVASIIQNAMIRIEEEQTPKRKIGIALIDIVRNDDTCEALGLDPWCVNEGAEGDELIEVNYDDAKKWGLI